MAIIGHINSLSGKELRIRHRKMFQQWNSSYFCSLHEYEKKNCQVVYTFVVGGYNYRSTFSPVLVDDSRPLVITNITTLPHYDDVNEPDVTILNIRENMNDGKTPTLFYWASQTAKRLGIHYVATCDSDAFLYPNAFLSILHQELSWKDKPPSTILGTLRHKIDWQVPYGDEEFWQREFFQGMHIYLGGQFYAMTVDVADLLVQGYRQNHSKVLTRIEDHDAIAMIQLESRDIPIRWIVLSQLYRFWKHPLKEWKGFGVFIQADKAKQDAGRVLIAPPVPQEPPGRKSLLVILGDVDQEAYRHSLINQQADVTVCSFLSHDICDLYYVFAMGMDSTGSTEELFHPEGLLSDENVAKKDVWPLNLRDNVNDGMATSVLALLTQEFPDYPERLDFVLFIQSRYMLQVSKWLAIQAAQTSPHNLLIGDVRETKTPRVEFMKEMNDAARTKEYDGIHLYLGSECLAISTTLAPKILEQAKTNSAPRNHFRRELGYDLSVLAYYIPRTVLQWVPITRTLRFWEAT